MNLNQLRTLVVAPALKHIGAYSPAAEQLLMGTIMQESGAKFLKQYPTGPALGIVQMEPATHDDLWQNYIQYRPELFAKLASLASRRDPGAKYPPSSELIGNLMYAVAMARVTYLRRKEPLPEAGDIPAMADYWKRWYNTEGGKGQPKEFLEKFPYELFQLPRVEVSARDTDKEKSE